LDAPNAIGQVINVGSGFEISIGDLARVIGEEMGTSFELAIDSIRMRPQASEVERLLASNTRAGNLLGWQPDALGIDGLRSGLRKTIAWFTQPENLARYRSGQYTV
jgi:dTDP-glucose 4,6-dehydratase